MTDKDINKLADKIADIVLAKFVNYYDNHEVLEIYRPFEQELIEGELERLDKMLIKYLNDEAYEKAAIIKRKIQILNNKLKND